MTSKTAATLKIGDRVKQHDQLGTVSRRDANTVGISWDTRPQGAEEPEQFDLASSDTLERVPKSGDHIVVRKAGGMFEIVKVVNGAGDRERVRANVTTQHQAWEIARGADVMVWICDEATPDAIETYR
jgi:hypothetical protein